MLTATSRPAAKRLTGGAVHPLRKVPLAAVIHVYVAASAYRPRPGFPDQLPSYGIVWCTFFFKVSAIRPSKRKRPNDLKPLFGVLGSRLFNKLGCIP